MSADNGIYILQTLNERNEDGYEYRVSHLQAIDNIGFHPDTQIINARIFWPILPVYKIRLDALETADALALKIEYLEYGINFIKIDRKYSILHSCWMCNKEIFSEQWVAKLNLNSQADRFFCSMICLKNWIMERRV